MRQPFKNRTFMKKERNGYITALRAAFPQTLPIMAGFLFLGTAYGVLMNAKGFSFLYPLFMSLFIYAGAMQFVAVNILLGAFNPLEAVLMTLVLNARHIFYGISLFDKFKGTGAKKPDLIFGMCDETFSLLSVNDAPVGVDKGLYMFFITLLNHIYWVLGSLFGGVFGSFVSSGVKGIDFVMTAMFAAIFVEQLRRGKRERISAIMGLLVSLVSLLIFKADSFVLPAMLGIAVSLFLARGVLHKNACTEGACDKNDA